MMTSAIACAIPTPSLGDVPLPNSSIITSEFLFATEFIASVERIIETVFISFAKVDREAYGISEVSRGRTYLDGVVVAEAGEESVDHTEAGVVGRDEASDLCEDVEERDLLEERRFARHVHSVLSCQRHRERWRHTTSWNVAESDA